MQYSHNILQSVWPLVKHLYLNDERVTEGEMFLPEWWKSGWEWNVVLEWWKSDWKWKVFTWMTKEWLKVKCFHLNDERVGESEMFALEWRKREWEWVYSRCVLASKYTCVWKERHCLTFAVLLPYSPCPCMLLFVMCSEILTAGSVNKITIILTVKNLPWVLAWPWGTAAEAEKCRYQSGYRTAHNQCRNWYKMYKTYCQYLSDLSELRSCVKVEVAVLGSRP